jgi:hypothetical protein
MALAEDDAVPGFMKGVLPVRRSRAARWSRFTGALAVPVLVIEAIGVRTGTLPTEAILPVLALGMALGVFALCFGLYALVDIWRSGSEGLGPAMAGILYSAPVLVLLAMLVGAAVIYPPLNDVSTDLDDPPDLSALGGAEEEPLAPEFAALQVSAYPELTPGDIPAAHRAGFMRQPGRLWKTVDGPSPVRARRPASPPHPASPRLRRWKRSRRPGKARC